MYREILCVCVYFGSVLVLLMVLTEMCVIRGYIGMEAVLTYFFGWLVIYINLANTKANRRKLG